MERNVPQKIEYATLVEKLPEMAKIVNAFTGEAAQAEALRALMGAAFGDGVPIVTKEPFTSPPDLPASVRKPTKQGTSRKSADIDLLDDAFLFPAGQPSIKQFVEGKVIETQGDLLTAVVYYMARIAKVEAITLSHVYTALKAVGKKPPASLRERLKDEKTKHNRLDTSDRDNIKITRTGIDFVEHDLVPNDTAAE